MSDGSKDSGFSLDSVTNWLGGFFRSAHGEQPKDSTPRLHGDLVAEEYCAIEGTGFYHCMGVSKKNPKWHEVPLDITRGVRPGQPITPAP